MYGSPVTLCIRKAHAGSLALDTSPTEPPRQRPSWSGHLGWGPQRRPLRSRRDCNAVTTVWITRAAVALQVVVLVSEEVV